MTAIDRDRARTAFKSYTDAYDATNPRIAQNRAYTYHVAGVLRCRSARAGLVVRRY